MGLDTFASRTPDDVVLSDEDVAAFSGAGVDLCGGIHSDGVTSIRGKVYAELVFEVTGVSLFQDWIGPDEVQRLSLALDAHSAEDLARVWDSLGGHGEPTHSRHEAEGLATFFRICAERELGLIGWW